jgi:hypothetical protein
MPLNIIKPPQPLPLSFEQKTVFLGGSIEMGKAGDWQEEVSQALKNYDLTILNPRRDQWDSSWEQSIDNPVFKEQVEWELEGLERADFRFFHFEAGTKSPITLMELGLCARMDNVLVHCAEGFWRKGNVDVVCARYGVQQVDSLQGAIDYLKQKLT